MGGEQPAPHAAEKHEGGGILGGFKNLFGGHHEAEPSQEPAADHIDQPVVAPETHEVAEPAPEPPMGELAPAAHTDVVATPDNAPLDLSGADVDHPAETEAGSGHDVETDGAQEGEPSHVEISEAPTEESPESSVEAAAPSFNDMAMEHATGSGEKAETTDSNEEATSSTESPVQGDGVATESEATNEVTATDDEAAAFLKEAQAASAGGSEVSPVDAEATPVSSDVTVQDGEVIPMAPHAEQSEGEVDTKEADEAVHQEGVATPTSAEEPAPDPEAESSNTPEVAPETEEATASHDDDVPPVMPIEPVIPTAETESQVTVDREATVVPETVTDTADTEKDPAKPSAEALAPVIDLTSTLRAIEDIEADIATVKTSLKEAIEKQKAA